MTFLWILLGIDHPGDPPPARPKPLAPSVMVGLECRRIATASFVEVEPGPSFANAFNDQTLMAPQLRQ